MLALLASLDPEIKCLLDEIKLDHEINQGHENNEAGWLKEDEKRVHLEEEGGNLPNEVLAEGS